MDNKRPMWVSRSIIEHSLNVDPAVMPRKQKLQKMSEDIAEWAKAEVNRLLEAGVIRPIDYPEWLTNVVMVRKANVKWRMCIDFIELNKACPKDEFPLPRIDTLVDAAVGLEMVSLLDCYSGYHQIWLWKEDKPKTSFITPFETYCYVRMPEGLKNAGGSFSRMTTKVTGDQWGRNVLTYVNDIIVQSTKKEDHIADLRETFINFRRAGLKLNPEKSIFRIEKGKFLGCLVSRKGIEANPTQIEAVLQMEPSTNKKAVQRLTGHLAALNRIISRSPEKSLPFFEVLRAANVFTWGASAIESIRGLESLSYSHDHIITTTARGYCPILHGRCTYGSQRCTSTRTNRRQSKETAAGILRIQSLDTN